MHVVSVVVALGVGAAAIRYFVRTGWPLAHGDLLGILGAASLLSVASGLRAQGWLHLFPPRERPDRVNLVMAGSATAVTGLALPSRLDEVVRIAIVRRLPGAQSGLGAICLSLFLLGLVDNAALVPLASVAAGVAAPSGLVRAGLIVVAAAGLLAAIVVLALPRANRVQRLVRFRLTRWLCEHSACPREASKAWLFVSLSWLLRGTALVVLLNAFGFGASIPLALAYLCAAAASSAIPIAPAGAVAQAGAGAAILIASGIPTSEAVAFAVAAQALGVFTGAALTVAGGLWHARVRLAPAHALARG